MVEVFKTNVVDEEAAAELLQGLQSLLPLATINFDLQDCDKILRVKINVDKLQQLVKTHLEEKNVVCEILE